MREGWELLIDHPMPRRAERFMSAMSEAGPAGSDVTSTYGGRRRCLMIYGPGAARKLPIIKQHIAAGGRVAMWDLGYWNREDAMRLSVDRLHPTAEQLAMAPDGPGRREFVLRQDASESGPVLLIGLGGKSVIAYGLETMGWERRKVKELAKRFRDRPIHWRPKGRRGIPLPFAKMVTDTPIEQALRGCSLVVCRHSNCAVDAAVAGVPVECEDGAALALYQGNPAPTPEQRAEFLRRLTWWEWSRFEAPQAWEWVMKVTA